jgi:hypothetical protein
MPARLGSWSLRAALPSVATAETPSSSPAAKASAAASSVLEIASEGPRDPHAQYSSISGLPVEQIQATRQHLSDQSTSIPLHASGRVWRNHGSRTFSPNATNAIDRPSSPRFAKLHRCPAHLLPNLNDAGIMRLNNAAESGKDLFFFPF